MVIGLQRLKQYNNTTIKIYTKGKTQRHVHLTRASTDSLSYITLYLTLPAPPPPTTSGHSWDVLVCRPRVEPWCCPQSPCWPTLRSLSAVWAAAHGPGTPPRGGPSGRPRNLDSSATTDRCQNTPVRKTYTSGEKKKRRRWQLQSIIRKVEIK